MLFFVFPLMQKHHPVLIKRLRLQHPLWQIGSFLFRLLLWFYRAASNSCFLIKSKLIDRFHWNPKTGYKRSRLGVEKMDERDVIAAISMIQLPCKVMCLTALAVMLATSSIITCMLTSSSVIL